MIFDTHVPVYMFINVVLIFFFYTNYNMYHVGDFFEEWDILVRFPHEYRNE